MLCGRLYIALYILTRETARSAACIYDRSRSILSNGGEVQRQRIKRAKR